MVAGRVSGTKTLTPHNWLVEPSNLVAQRDAILVARTLCQQSQLGTTVPVEIYNPSGEPVQLYSETALSILTPIETITNIQLETVPGTERIVKEAKM